MTRQTGATGATEARVRSYVERRDALTRQLQERLVEVLQLDCEAREIGRDSPLFGAGLGLDSVDAVAIAATVESELGIVVNDEDLQAFRSVNTIIDFVLLALGEAPDELAGEVDTRTELEEERREVHSEYWALREAVGLLDRSDCAPLLLPSHEWGEVLDSLVGAHVAEMAVGELQQTALLETDGTVADLVWVGRHGDGYLLISEGRQHDRWQIELGRLASSLPVERPPVRVPTVVGPGAQELVVDLFGEDLLRVGYGEIAAAPWYEGEVPVLRCGGSGEYEYRFPVAAGVAAKIEAELGKVGKALGLHRCDAGWIPTLMLEMKSIDVRTMVPPGTSPAQLDLHWMMPGAKNVFRGRDAYLASLDSGFRRAVTLVASWEGAVAGGGERSALHFGESRVGELWMTVESPRVGAVLGLAFVDDELAWPGVPLRGEDGPWVCRSAPLFLTRSVLDALNV